MNVIVAGIARSGLTMTMQMLHAGGFPVAGTYPDFEPFSLGQAPWGRMTGKAVKLVDTHRQFPPAGEYRVIRLHRNLKQQAASFNKWNRMLMQLPAVRPTSLIRSMKRDYVAIDAWKQKQHAHIDIDFERILESPIDAAVRIADFVGGNVDVARMAGAVIARSPKCYEGLLELEMLKRS